MFTFSNTEGPFKFYPISMWQIVNLNYIVHALLITIQLFVLFGSCPCKNQWCMHDSGQAHKSVMANCNSVIKSLYMAIRYSTRSVVCKDFFPVTSIAPVLGFNEPPVQKCSFITVCLLSAPPAGAKAVNNKWIKDAMLRQ